MTEHSGGYTDSGQSTQDTSLGHKFIERTLSLVDPMTYLAHLNKNTLEFLRRTPRQDIGKRLKLTVQLLDALL